GCGRYCHLGLSAQYYPQAAVTDRVSLAVRIAPASALPARPLRFLPREAPPQAVATPRNRFDHASRAGVAALQRVQSVFPTCAQSPRLLFGLLDVRRSEVDR